MKTNECNTKQMRAFTASLAKGEGSAVRDVRKVLTAMIKADARGMTKFEYATKNCQGVTADNYDSSGSYDRFAPRVCVTLCFNGLMICLPNETGPGLLRYYTTITADQIEDAIARLITDGCTRPKNYKSGAQAHGSDQTELYCAVTRKLHDVVGIDEATAKLNVTKLLSSKHKQSLNIKSPKAARG